MRLDLGKIRTPHERFEQMYPPEAFAADPESFRIVAPVSLAFDVYKDGSQFRLAGHTKTTLELPCSRCLEPLTTPVDVAFDLRYQPHTANAGDSEREIEEDDLSTAFYENDEIDLEQLMREQFYLALPMKPLCTEALPRFVPGLRDEPQPRHVRLQARLGRSTAGSFERT